MTDGPNAAMVKRYAHVAVRLRWGIADQLNALLWASNETNDETDGSLKQTRKDLPATGAETDLPESPLACC